MAIKGVALSKWRDVAVEDMPVLEELNREQQKLTGREGNIQAQEWPVFSPKVLEKNGQVIGLAFLQATLQVIGVHPECAIRIREIGPELEAEAKKRGMRFVHAALEPKAKSVGRLLEQYGFKKLSREIEVYYLDLERGR